LIEVLAGLAITGSVLVAILLAQARFAAQMGRAQAKQEAVVVAEQLLEGWWSDLEHFPIDARGAAGGPWEWETQAVAHPELATVGLKQVRIMIRPRTSNHASPSVPPLVSLDVIVPIATKPRSQS
jgi:type II secretory pathway pseudopilin PulG